MRPDLKKEWVKALRSGEYKQCQGNLHGATGTHCCLGVLDVIVKAKEPNTRNGPLLKAFYKIDWGTFIRMNDDEGKSFNEIADWIEENVPEEVIS